MDEPKEIGGAPFHPQSRRADLGGPTSPAKLLGAANSSYVYRSAAGEYTKNNLAKKRFKLLV